VIKDDQTSRAAPPDAQTIRPTGPQAISDADYEQMYHLLYAYRFSSISFLELLDKLEVILQINPSQASCQTNPD
jgi:hypothetical protein